MVLIYDVSNYCSESRPFRLHSAFNLTEFKWHKMPFSKALAGILYISFQWKTFTCKYSLFGVGQMRLSWLMKAFDHSSTNWNLEKEEAIWTGICNSMNYLVHIIHKSLWREGFMRFYGEVVIVVLPASMYAVFACIRTRLLNGMFHSL